MKVRGAWAAHAASPASAQTAMIVITRVGQRSSASSAPPPISTAGHVTGSFQPCGQ